MGGPFTYVCPMPHVIAENGASADVTSQLTHPAQNVRYYRGVLYDYLPRWFPLRDWIVNPRYDVYICSPSTEQFSTIADFYASAKKVVIDSTHKFTVSLSVSIYGSIAEQLDRMRRRRTSGWRALVPSAKSSSSLSSYL